MLDRYSTERAVISDVSPSAQGSLSHVGAAEPGEILQKVHDALVVSEELGPFEVLKAH